MNALHLARTVAVSIVLLGGVLASAAPVPKTPPDKLEQTIAPARKKAIDFLKSRQSADGTWEIPQQALADMTGGRTGLATLALLHAGMPASDPALARAIAYLAKLPPKKTYVVSLQTQVLARADARKHAQAIQASADWLVEKAIWRNGALVGWSYPGNEVADGSNSHFAVVALHAAQQAGAKVDEKLWPAIRDLYVATRTRSGWAYRGGPVATGTASESMTAAALVCLAIAGKHLKQADRDKEAFAEGMEALLTHSSGAGNSRGYQDLVNAELGQLLGTREFKSSTKTVAWFREGAERLLKEQHANGAWDREKLDADGVLTTAYALYFLGPPPK